MYDLPLATCSTSMAHLLNELKPQPNWASPAPLSD